MTTDLLPHQIEEEQLGVEVHRLEQAIIEQVRKVQVEWWALAEQLHAFNELKGWKKLGHEQLTEFLAQPDITLSRAQYFRLIRVWEDLIIVKGIDPGRLSNIEPSKVHEVTPAIMRGQVTVDEGLDKAQALGARDLREEFRPNVPPVPLPTEQDPPEYQLPDAADEVCTLTNSQVIQLCFECASIGNKHSIADTPPHVISALGDRGISVVAT